MNMRMPKFSLKKFREDRKGSVSIEFILILPLLGWWYAASFAFFDGFKDYNVTVKTAAVIGDIVSRQIEVDNDFLDGMETILEYMTNTNNGVWSRVSSVKFTEDDGYTVEWSHATSSHDPLTTANVYLYDWDELWLPNMANGETIILVETYVPYAQAFNVGLSDRTWRNIVVTRPRFTSQITNTDFTSPGS